MVIGSSREVSTGIDSGSWCRLRWDRWLPEGVPGTEGVKGGVKAGEMRLWGTPPPGVPGCEVLSKSDQLLRYCAEGRATGAITGDACEGSLSDEVILRCCSIFACLSPLCACHLCLCVRTTQVLNAPLCRKIDQRTFHNLDKGE